MMSFVAVRILWILLFGLPFSVLSLYIAPVYASPQDELRGVKSQINAKKQQISKTKKVEKAVSGKLQAITKTLTQKERELKVLDADLKKVEATIAQTRKSIDIVSVEAKQKQLQIEQRLTILYKAGNLGPVRMFFSAESFPQMAENNRFMERILARDKVAFSEYLSKLNELKELKAKLEREATVKEKLIKSIAEKKKEIELERQKTAKQLNTVKLDRQGQEASLKELEANASRLQSMLNRLNAQSRKRPSKPSAGEKEAKRTYPDRPTSPDRGFASQQGRLAMPVRGRILLPYGKHKHPEFNSYTFNKGIVISAASGTDVRAIYDGTVLYAGYFKGYGNMIIIDHGAGYFSLYAYNARISKRVGASITKGDIVAAVGDVDSTVGPALYFEIRHQGQPVNPSGWVR